VKEFHYFEKPYLPHYKLYWDRTLLTEKIVHFNRRDLSLVFEINEDAAFIYIVVPLIPLTALSGIPGDLPVVFSLAKYRGCA